MPSSEKLDDVLSVSKKDLLKKEAKRSASAERSGTKTNLTS
jgi:hypothetical protein